MRYVMPDQNYSYTQRFNGFNAVKSIKRTNLTKLKLVLVILFLHFNSNLLMAQDTVRLAFRELPEAEFVKVEETIIFSITDTLNPANPVNFVVRSEDAVNFDYDAESKTFSYKGTIAQKEEFTIDFFAVYRDSTVQKQINFIPKLSNSEETDILSVPGIYQPNGNSFEHTTITQSTGAKTSLNYVDRPTRVVQISAGTVIIDVGQPIMDFNRNEDIESMMIVGDTVIFRDSLILPQTDVNVLARVLIFEDRDSVTTAGIKTTPVSLGYRALNAGINDTIGYPGAHGLTAGKISINAREVILPTGDDRIRLIATGGEGQDPGLGIDGVVGRSMGTVGGEYTHNGLVHGMVFYIRTYRVSRPFNKTKTERRGSRVWPGDGTDAVSAGIPGNGGKGGLISANFQVAGIMDNSGGIAGTPADTTFGGVGGSPRHAYWFENYRSNPIRRYFRSSSDGINKPAPMAEVALGENGDYQQMENPFAWLSPIMVRKVLVLGKEAYINGGPSYTYTSFATYLDAINQYQELPAWDSLSVSDQTALSTLAGEMEIIMLRIESNQDYFGNEYGYAPYLSFEFFLQNYNLEIERSMRIMYLIYLFEDANATFEQKKASLSLLKAQKEDEMVSLIESYERDNELIPPLAIELANYQRARDSLDVERQRVEQNLLRQANRNIKDKNKLAKFKKIVSIATTVASFIPGGQSVAIAANAINQFNFDKPFSLSNLQVVRNAYNGIKSASNDYDMSIENTIGATKTAFEAVKNTDIGQLVFNSDYRDSIQNVVKNIKEQATPVIKAYDAIKTNYRSLKVSNSEVRAELERLKSSSPELQAFIQQIEEVQSIQRGVIDNHFKIRGMMLKSQADMIQNLLAIDQMNKSIATSSEYIDQDMISYVQDMKQRSQENLLKYHYLMAKAFEYRLLENYGQRLDLNGIYSRMQELLEAGNGGILSADSYHSLQGLYDDQISSVVSRIINEYEFDRKESTISFRLDSTQLAVFNSTGKIIINPVAAGFIFDGYEDVRLTDFAVTRAQYDVEDNAYTHLASKIEIKHSGISTLIKDGTPFQFKNISINNPQPHRWTSIVDAVGENITDEKPSPLDESLLNAILALGGHDGGNILFFSSPAANADIFISRVDLNGDGQRLDFEELVFTLKYDYVPQSTEDTRIKVGANIGKPAIYVDKADKNDRANGYAAFTRHYLKSYSDLVALEPIEDYGEYKFSHWSDQYGNQLTAINQTGNTLHVPLHQNQSVLANYELWRSKLSVAQDSIYLSGIGGNASFNIQSKGNNPLLRWEIESTPDWISLSGGDSGQGEINYHFTYETNLTDSIRSGYIVVLNNDVIGDIDTIAVKQDFASHLMVAVDSVEMPYQPSSKTVIVDVNTGDPIVWNATVSGDGFQIPNSETGVGRGDVVISADANFSRSVREGLLTISDSLTSHEVYIYQAADPNPARVIVSPDTIVVDALAGIDSLKIETTYREDVVWTGSLSGAQFSVLDEAEGVGEGFFKFSITENTSREAVYGTLTISDPLGIFEIPVMQVGNKNPDRIIVAESAISFSHQESVDSLLISTQFGESVIWNASISGEGFSITGSSTGEGEGYLNLAVHKNISRESRSGILMISDGVINYEVLLNQDPNSEPAVVILSVDTIYIDEYGGVDSLWVATTNDEQVNWNANIVEGNFTIEGEASGIRSRHLLVAGSKNENRQVNLGILQISDGISDQFVTIIQQGNTEPARILVAQDTVFIPASGGVDTIWVKTTFDDLVLWNASITGNGFYIDGVVSSLGEGYVVIGGLENTGDEARIASLVISDSQFSYPVMIKQEAVAPVVSGFDIDELTSGQSFYPNPMHDLLIIDFENTPYAVGDFILMDLSGKVVMRRQLSGKKTEIDVSHLQNGVYIGNYVFEEVILSKRLIKH